MQKEILETPDSIKNVVWSMNHLSWNGWKNFRKLQEALSVMAEAGIHLQFMSQTMLLSALHTLNYLHELNTFIVDSILL